MRVDAAQIPDVIALMEQWISKRNGCHCVALAGMFGLTEARRDAAVRTAFNSADLVVPDGMPLIWIARLRGVGLKRRVYGPELMTTFCRDTFEKGYRHFFLGGAPGVPAELAANLQLQFPGLKVAGSFSPPFGNLTAEEDEKVVRMINESQADVLWVGLGSPKQDRWMHEHRERLNVPVLVAVGAAFDFHSGRLKQAPEWMRENGLEWLFRLGQEPKRLWKRYIVRGSEFVACATLELLGLKRFD